jgi:hypothetical protein
MSYMQRKELDIVKLTRYLMEMFGAVKGGIQAESAGEQYAFSRAVNERKHHRLAIVLLECLHIKCWPSRQVEPPYAHRGSNAQCRSEG